MEKSHHKHGGHDRITKQYSAGNTGVHVAKTKIKRGGRHGEKGAQNAKTDSMAGLDLKTFALRYHPNGKHEHRQGIAIEQDRARRYAAFIEIKRTKRIGTIEHSGQIGR